MSNVIVSPTRFTGLVYPICCWLLSSFFFLQKLHPISIAHLSISYLRNILMLLCIWKELWAPRWPLWLSISYSPGHHLIIQPSLFFWCLHIASPKGIAFTPSSLLLVLIADALDPTMLHDHPETTQKFKLVLTVLPWISWGVPPADFYSHCSSPSSSESAPSCLILICHIHVWPSHCFQVPTGTPFIGKQPTWLPDFWSLCYFF